MLKIQHALPQDRRHNKTMSTGMPDSIDKVICRMELGLRPNIHSRRSKFHTAVYENHDSNGTTTSLTTLNVSNTTTGKVQPTKILGTMQQGFFWPKNGICLAQKSPNWGFKINSKFLQLHSDDGDNQGLVWPKIPKLGILN